MFKKRKIKEMFDEPHEIVGWFGMLIILLAYGLLSLAFLSATSIAYQIMNAFGALALIYTAFKTSAYPVVVLNVVWLLIAIFALL